MASAKTVISSYVLETVPGRCEQARAAISMLEGVEIHHQEGGKLIVTIEAPSLDATYALATKLTKIKSILTTNLVYCNFEDEYRDEYR
jgi:nitrate reductase NapD